MSDRGWICPKCEKVYAPSVEECGACNEVHARAPAPPYVWIYPSPPWPNYPQPYVGNPVPPLPLNPTITWEGIC